MPCFGKYEVEGTERDSRTAAQTRLQKTIVMDFDALLIKDIRSDEALAVILACLLTIFENRTHA